MKIDLAKHPYMVIGWRERMTTAADPYKTTKYNEHDLTVAFCSNRDSALFLADIRKGRVYFRFPDGAFEPVTPGPIASRAPALGAIQ